MFSRIVLCVLCFLTVHSFIVEGSSKTVKLHAFYLTRIQETQKVTGPSKIYDIETLNITNTTRNESVLSMSLLQHRLLPGDKLTFYDGNLTTILQEYTALTHTPALSFYSTLPDAKVVFTANASNVNSTRSFIFLYRTAPKDTAKECNRIFYGRWGVIDTSKHNLGSNESCRYTVSLAPLGFHSISLLFDNLNIPPGEKLLIRKTTRWHLQPYGAPVKVFTHANNGRLHYIEPQRMQALALEFNSTTQFKIRFQDYNRDFKEVGESGEITIPIKPRPKNFYLKYLITVPKGFAKLTLHDLFVPNYETIRVYRFTDRSRELIRTFDNSSDLETATIVSDSNRLVAIFSSSQENSTANFRMRYSVVETAPKPCSTSLLSVKSSSSYSKLYQGWEHTYDCEEGYGNKKSDRFTVLCQANGVWSYTEGAECRKMCPAFDSIYDISARGLFASYDLEIEHRSGDNLTFFCDSSSDELDNDVKVTCTSSGNYSAPPPYCTERRRQSNLALVLSLSLSAPFLFFAALVLGYVVLRHTNCLSAELRVKLFGPGVVSSSQHRAVELQENSPLDTITEDANIGHCEKNGE